MSENPAGPAKDPVVRFLIGCAVVGLVFVVLVVGGIAFLGWRLSRDETAGRPEEVFLAGDEARYWCLDLRPDDLGLVALIGRLDDEAEAARADALKNSPFRNFPFVRKRNQARQLLPLKLELAAAEDGWSARGTFSKQLFRIRAAIKLMRFILGRDKDNVSRVDAGGVDVTAFHDSRSGASFALTMVGNRVIAANDAPRLERNLAIPDASRPPLDPAIAALHDAIRFDGEDGWAFAPDAVASFDVNAHDELAFRITVRSEAEMTTEQALSVVKSMLPYLPDQAFQLDATTRGEDGRTIVSGRVDDLAARLGAMVLRFSATQAEKKRSGTRSPSATPIPPSPPPSSNPRTDTPEAPKRGESPIPAH